jgi:hypothetical protein
MADDKPEVFDTTAYNPLPLVSDGTTWQLDFEQIAKDCLLVIFPETDETNIVEALRRVWNARGDADIQAYRQTDQRADPEDSIRKLDR